jgi:hypothetical protein
LPTNKVFSPSLAQAKVMKRLEEMSSQIDRIADVQKKIMQRLNVLLRCAQDARAETNHAGELEQLKNILLNGAVVHNQIHTDKHGNYKIYTRTCKEYGDFDHCQQPNACPYVQPRANTANPSSEPAGNHNISCSNTNPSSHHTNSVVHGNANN